MFRIPATVAVGALAVLLTAGCSDDDGAGDPVTATTATIESAGPPVALEVEGPITEGERGVPYNAMPEGFEEDYDYVEEEYFVSGTATSFDPAGPLAADGAWELTPGATAEYTTRILVRQPADPADFNGVVLVEWNNVTAGRDSDPGFGMLHPEVLAAGYGFVAASVQEVSIEGGAALLEIPGVPAEVTLPLKEWDPVLYAPLDHPGDEFSYDMFSQIGAMVEGRTPASPFDGQPVESVIALGESQSAGRMVSYVNGVHPLAQTYDGFMIHSRGASAGSFGDGPEDSPAGGVLVRDDLSEPVLLFATETDLTFLGSLSARQPDSDGVTSWEVAGTAHADQATLDYGIASGRRWSTASADFTELCGRINTGPQAEVARAALVRLRAWVQEGTPPPAAPRIETDSVGGLARDGDGNVLGGIRTPDVDAPVSTLTGTGSTSSIFCSLFGREIPFTTERLAALYASHQTYVERVTDSADAALEAGFLLPADRDAIVAGAT